MIQFRVPVEADKSIIENWIACDAEHSEKRMTPEFFFVDTALAMVIGDDRGPGLFIRVDPATPDSVRLHIQFSPNEVKSMKNLLRGWAPFAQGVWNAGVKRMVFESKSKCLIGFCKGFFGFQHIAGTDDYELIHEVS